MGNELRRLPGVDYFLNDDKIKQLLAIFPHDFGGGLDSGKPGMLPRFYL